MAPLFFGGWRPHSLTQSMPPACLTSIGFKEIALTSSIALFLFHHSFIYPLAFHSFTLHIFPRHTGGAPAANTKSPWLFGASFLVEETGNQHKCIMLSGKVIQNMGNRVWCSFPQGGDDLDRIKENTEVKHEALWVMDISCCREKRHKTPEMECLAWSGVCDWQGRDIGITPTLQSRKLRIREAIHIGQGHTARKWQSCTPLWSVLTTSVLRCCAVLFSSLIFRALHAAQTGQSFLVPSVLHPN